MTLTLSTNRFLAVTAKVWTWMFRCEIRRAPQASQDRGVAAALRREELRQRPWEARN